MVAHPAALASEKAYQRDELERQLTYFSALAAYHAERERVYEAAAKDTSMPIPPALPIPESDPAVNSVYYCLKRSTLRLLPYARR